MEPAGRALRLVVLTFVAQGLYNLRVKGMRTNRPGPTEWIQKNVVAPRKMKNSVATTRSSNPSNSPIISIFSDSKSK